MILPAVPLRQRGAGDGATADLKARAGSSRAVRPRPALVDNPPLVAEGGEGLLLSNKIAINRKIPTVYLIQDEF